ncbi:hypothetical protein G6F67_009633 [Rhizopus microsporus]|nr:hypothetical protein G6F67_009633 [Rhizopus microsporus]
MGQGTMARSIGVNLGTVQTHRAQLQQLHFLSHFQHLDKNTGQLIQETAAEARQGVVIRVLVRGDEAKRHRIVGRPLDLAAGEDARGIAVDQQREQ